MEILREHHNLIEASGVTDMFRMLAVGRVDYAVVNLAFGMYVVPKMGLSGKIQPPLTRSISEEGLYICFSKMSVSPSLVDVFSRTLKEFKQTEVFRAIYRKYFP